MGDLNSEKQNKVQVLGVIIDEKIRFADNVKFLV